MNIISNKEMKNAGWIVGEQVFQMAISVILSLLSARYLGPSNFGLINYTASFVVFVSSVVTLGMDGVIIKKMIDNPDREGEYLGSAIGFRLISSVLCSIAIITTVYYLNPGDKTVMVLISIQSVQLVFQALQILDSWFQRHLKSKSVSIAKMIACIIVSGYKMYLLITAKDLRWFAFSNSLSMMVITAILLISYRRCDVQPLRFSASTGMELLKDSYHFILAGLMVAIYGQMDRIMLKEMVSSEAVGLYSTAAAVCTAWLFVPMAIINSLRPGIMEAKSAGQEDYYMSRLKKLYSLIFWMCTLVAAAISLTGEFLVNLLYGAKYLGATSALKILIWSEIFSMIGTARGIWIISEKKNRYIKYYLGLGAALNLILNALLIPHYGINGASVATLATQIFTSLIAPLFFSETRIHTRIVFQSMTLPWKEVKKWLLKS